MHDDGGLQIVALFQDMVQPSWRKDIIGGAVCEFIASPHFQYILWPEMGSRSFLFWVPATMIFLSLYTVPLEPESCIYYFVYKFPRLWYFIMEIEK